MKVGIVDLNAVDAQQLVTESLIESGFAVVKNHEIPVSELNGLYEGWNHFFLNGNPGQYVTDVESQAGYFSPYFAETAKGNEAQDLKEYFHYWPGDPLPTSVEKLTLHYYDAVFDLGKDVMAWLQANSPTTLWKSIDRPFEQYLSRNQTLLRILRYPPLTGNEPPESIRAGAHEDINLITMLPAASESGLQIKPKGTDDWIPVEAPAGSIVINVGDMLQELTDGAMPSTTHQVVNPTGDSANKARLTAPVFCHPRPEMVLSDKYTAKSYLHERLSEINSEELRPS
jgi:isopenicillin N synthase-like dioxygenase